MNGTKNINKGFKQITFYNKKILQNVYLQIFYVSIENVYNMYLYTD